MIQQLFLGSLFICFMNRVSSVITEEKPIEYKSVLEVEKWNQEE